uniref:Programmed cell death protein 2 C-terminal domain-containing protein n=1 Tax=Kalanchoe fedtschenkoi TaxID=63787 RepID=A0A7N0TRF6_KALFE
MDQILVGVPGPWANDYSEPADHYTSKIGGIPDLPFPVETLGPGLLECATCGCSLSLVSQVYAPVHTAEIKIEERTIYVFGCVQPECGHSHLSWRALRLQKLHDGSAHDASPQALDKSVVSCPTVGLWDDDDQDVNDDFNLEELSKAFKDLASLTSHSSKENAKKQLNKTSKTSVKDSPLDLQSQVISSSAPVLPCFYLYIQEEPSATVNRSKPLLPDENQFNLHDHEAETWDQENYEYDKALSADRTYLKYKKIIDSCPQQCFRYKYGGKPVSATQTVHEPSPCQLCGAPRLYEMQLMPPLVYFLHEGADESKKYSVDNWNWMALIVYTCSKNCCAARGEVNNMSHGWTVAVEEIELQLEGRAAIFSPLLATGPAESAT